MQVAQFNPVRFNSFQADVKGLHEDSSVLWRPSSHRGGVRGERGETAVGPREGAKATACLTPSSTLVSGFWADIQKLGIL